MTGVRARLAAVAVVMTAAVALLAGCGSSSDSAHGTPHKTAEAPAASSPGIGPDGTAEQTAQPSDAPATKQPTVPKAQLTPATGTFTAKERDYLVGKVPKGMDPAAILQTGQESCERIANTADVSTKLAEQAIKDGEIADAKDAITYLCPRYADLLH